MKPTSLLVLSTLISFTCIMANAQPKGANTLQLPPKNIKIDGDISDWGDSLRYNNEEKKLNYSLANDKENLYMAIRVNDHSEQMRILNSGLTVSINTKGKKKETYSITFPVGGSENRSTLENLTAGAADSPDDHDELMRARITKLRNIRVSGFPDIESDMITTANTYGIQVAISYDDHGYLDYEAAIPLKFFHADNIEKNEWAFNFKINGFTRPENHVNNTQADNQTGGRGMGGGRGGMGGGGMRGGGRGGMRGGGFQGNTQTTDHSEMGKSVDFWEKFYLTGNN